MFSSTWSPPTNNISPGSDCKNTNKAIKGAQNLVSKGLRLPAKGDLNYGIIKESCEFNGNSFKEKVAEALENNSSMCADTYKFLNSNHDFLGFKEFQKRTSIISKHEELNTEVQDFVSEKSPQIFKTNVRQTDETYSNFLWKCYASLDKYKFLPPLEYFLDVGPELCEKQFLKSLCAGDILFGKVIEHQENDTHILQIIATGGHHHRYLIGTNMKAELRWNDFMPLNQNIPLTVKLNLKRKMLEIKTLLTVEVLHTSNIVNGKINPGEMICVGTKGIVLQKLYYDLVEKENSKANKFVLGKVDIVKNSNAIPLILKSIEMKGMHSYDECLMELKLNSHSKSKHVKICKGLNFQGDFRHSLMNSIHNSSFTWYESENLRDAQNKKWSEEACQFVLHNKGINKEPLHDGSTRVRAMKSLGSSSAHTMMTENENMTHTMPADNMAIIANIIINHAKSHNRLYRYKDALRGLNFLTNEFEMKDSMSYEIIMEYARERESTKNFKEAKKLFRKCLEFNPENEEAVESFDRLKQLNSEEGKDQNIEELEKLLDYRTVGCTFGTGYPSFEEWKIEPTCWFYNFSPIPCRRASFCKKKHHCSVCNNAGHGYRNCPQNTIIFIKYNRSSRFTEEDLRECFSNFGMVASCSIPKKSFLKYAHVEFVTADAAEKARKHTSKLYINDQLLAIRSDPADKEPDKDIPPHLIELCHSGILEEVPEKFQHLRCTVCNVSCKAHDMGLHVAGGQHKLFMHDRMIGTQSIIPTEEFLTPAGVQTTALQPFPKNQDWVSTERSGLAASVEDVQQTSIVIPKEVVITPAEVQMKPSFTKPQDQDLIDSNVSGSADLKHSEKNEIATVFVKFLNLSAHLGEVPHNVLSRGMQEDVRSFVNITEDDLRKCFSQFGKVNACKLTMQTQRKNTFAVVDFENTNAALNSANQTRKLIIKGNVLKIKLVNNGDKDSLAPEIFNLAASAEGVIIPTGVQAKPSVTSPQDQDVIKKNALGSTDLKHSEEKEGTKLFIRSKSLSNITVADLKSCFSQFGEVGYCQIPKMHDGTNRNIAFLTLMSEEAANKAIKQTNELWIKGNVLFVEKKTSEVIPRGTVPCWYYNIRPEGCTHEASQCKNLHICGNCQQSGHPKINCPKFGGSHVAKDDPPYITYCWFYNNNQPTGCSGGTNQAEADCEKLHVCSECSQRGHYRLICPELKRCRAVKLKDVVPTLEEWGKEPTCYFYNFSTKLCKSETYEQGYFTQRRSGCIKQHTCNNCYQVGHPHLTCPEVLPTLPGREQRATSKQQIPTQDEWKYETNCWFFNFANTGCGVDFGCRKLHICSECHQAGHSSRDCPHSIRVVAATSEGESVSANTLRGNMDIYPTAEVLATTEDGTSALTTAQDRFRVVSGSSILSDSERKESHGVFIKSHFAGITEYDLKKCFSQFGKINTLNLNKNERRGNNFAFVGFYEADAAINAARQSRKLTLKGNLLKISVTGKKKPVDTAKYEEFCYLESRPGGCKSKHCGYKHKYPKRNDQENRKRRKTEDRFDQKDRFGQDREFMKEEENRKRRKNEERFAQEDRFAQDEKFMKEEENRKRRKTEERFAQEDRFAQDGEFMNEEDKPNNYNSSSNEGNTSNTSASTQQSTAVYVKWSKAFDITEDDLRQCFGQFGRIPFVDIRTERALIAFEDTDAAHNAARQTRKINIKGGILKITLAGRKKDTYCREEVLTPTEDRTLALVTTDQDQEWSDNAASESTVLTDLQKYEDRMVAAQSILPTEEVLTPAEVQTTASLTTPQDQTPQDLEFIDSNSSGSTALQSSLKNQNCRVFVKFMQMSAYLGDMPHNVLSRGMQEDQYNFVSITEDDLIKCFSQFGKVDACSVTMKEQRKNAFAVVDFKNTDAATNSAKESRKLVIKGNVLKVRVLNSGEKSTAVYVKWSKAFDITDDDLRQCFGQFGRTHFVNKIRKCHGRQDMSALIEFEDADAAFKAVKQTSKINIKGGLLTIKFADRKKDTYRREEVLTPTEDRTPALVTTDQDQEWSDKAASGSTVLTDSKKDRDKMVATQSILPTEEVLTPAEVQTTTSVTTPQDQTPQDLEFIDSNASGSSALQSSPKNQIGRVFVKFMHLSAHLGDMPHNVLSRGMQEEHKNFVSITEDDLIKCFSQFGKVDACRLTMKEQRKNSFAVVDFKNTDAAANSAKESRKLVIKGNVLKVRLLNSGEKEGHFGYEIGINSFVNEQRKLSNNAGANTAPPQAPKERISGAAAVLHTLQEKFSGANTVQLAIGKLSGANTAPLVQGKFHEAVGKFSGANTAPLASGNISGANTVPLDQEDFPEAIGKFSGANTAPLALGNISRANFAPHVQGKFSGANTAPLALGNISGANFAPYVQGKFSGANTAPHAVGEVSGANIAPNYLIYGRRGIKETNLPHEPSSIIDPVDREKIRQYDKTDYSPTTQPWNDTLKSQHIQPHSSNESISESTESSRIRKDLSTDIIPSTNPSTETVAEIRTLLSSMSGDQKKIWEKRFENHVASMEEEIEKAFANDKSFTRSLDDKSFDNHINKIKLEIEEAFINDEPSMGRNKDHLNPNPEVSPNRKRKMLSEEKEEIDMMFFIGKETFDPPDNRPVSGSRDSGECYGSKKQKIVLEDEDLCDKSLYNLFVRGLSIDRTKEEVREFFSDYGVINDVHLEWSENPTFMGEQTAYIEFKRTDDVNLVLNQTQNLYIKDSLISIQKYVDFSKSSDIVIFVSGFTHVGCDTKRDLIDYFNKFSSVKTLFLNTNSKNLHYAFVAFQSKEAVEKIVSTKEPYIFHGDILKLKEVRIVKEEKDLEKLALTAQSVSVSADKFSPRNKQSVNILKEIMGETGATYEFVLNHHTSINQNLTVHGTPEQIFSAKKLINENLGIQMSRKLAGKEAEKDPPKMLIITENIYEVLESICLKEVDLELDTCVRVLENMTLAMLHKYVTIILNKIINVRYVIFVLGIQDLTKNVNTSEGCFNVPKEENVMLNEFLRQQQEVSERLHNQFAGVQFLWTTPLPYCFEKYNRQQMSKANYDSLAPQVIPKWCWRKIQINFHKCLIKLRKKMLETDPHHTVDFLKLFLYSNNTSDGLSGEQKFLEGEVSKENWLTQDGNNKLNIEGGRALRYCIRKAVQRQILWGSDREGKSEWHNYLQEMLYKEQQERDDSNRDLKLLPLPNIEEILQMYGASVK